MNALSCILHSSQAVITWEFRCRPCSPTTPRLILLDMQNLAWSSWPPPHLLWLNSSLNFTLWDIPMILSCSEQHPGMGIFPLPLCGPTQAVVPVIHLFPYPPPPPAKLVVSREEDPWPILSIFLVPTRVPDIRQRWNFQYPLMWTSHNTVAPSALQLGPQNVLTYPSISMQVPLAITEPKTNTGWELS